MITDPTTAGPAPAPNAAESSRGYHRLVTLQDCERRYGFRYALRLEPQRTALPLALGSLLHLALMHRHRAQAGLDALDPVDAMRAAPARIAHAFGKALGVWQRYVPWADAEDAAWTVLDVEREFEARIGGRRITIRADLVVREVVTGRVQVVDHKSTSGDLHFEIQTQGGSGQIALEDLMGAHVIAPLYDAEFGGVVINAVGTAGQAGVAERGVAPVSGAWRDAVLASLGRLLERAEAIEAAPGWNSEAGVFALPVSPEACKGRFRDSRCPYFGLCREGPIALRSSRSGFDAVVDELTLLREASGA